MLDGKFDISKFIISKTLKAEYKADRNTIVHVGLADRME